MRETLPADHQALEVEPTAAELAAARRYAVLIQWSDEDRAYIAELPEFGQAHTHGATRAEAVANAEEVIALALAAARALGEGCPPPRLFPPARPTISRRSAQHQRLLLALGRIGQAGEDVLVCQIGEVVEHFLLGHLPRQV